MPAEERRAGQEEGKGCGPPSMSTSTGALPPRENDRLDTASVTACSSLQAPPLQSCSALQVYHAGRAATPRECSRQGTPGTAATQHNTALHYTVQLTRHAMLVSLCQILNCAVGEECGMRWRP